MLAGMVMILAGVWGVFRDRHQRVLASNPIRKTGSFRFRKKWFFCEIEEGKDFRGVVLAYVAQGNSKPDAEIAKKRSFRAETSVRTRPDHE